MQILCSFFDFLRDITAQNVFSDSGKKVVTESSIKLYGVFNKVRDFFSEQHQFEVVTWHLRGAILFQLQTDDSFQFASVSKQLLDIIESLPGICDEKVIENILTDATALDNSVVSEDAKKASVIASEVDEARGSAPCDRVLRERITAVLDCMEVSYRSYNRDWAKERVDKVFAAAARRRLGFPSDLRDRLDDLTTTITMEQRRILSGGGNLKTLRTYDSMAHPLLQKRVGILR